MSRINKRYSNSKNNSKDKIWSKLPPENNVLRIKGEQSCAQNGCKTTNSLNKNEYQILKEKVKTDQTKNGKSKNIKQYYNNMNILPESRSRKIRSSDPVTLNLQHIIDNYALSLASKQETFAKRVNKSVSSLKCKRRSCRGKISPSEKTTSVSERNMTKRLIYNDLGGLRLDQLKIEDESKEECVIQNLSKLNIFGQDHRQSFPIILGDDTVESRPDLIVELEKLKIGSETIRIQDCIETALNRMNMNENNLNENDFNKRLSIIEGLNENGI